MACPHGKTLFCGECLSDATGMTTEPKHPGNRRTAVIAGKAYHWRETRQGRLQLWPGKAPERGVA